MPAAKALASLHMCVDSPKPSLLADAISIKISCAGPHAFTSALLIYSSELDS